MKWQRYLFNFLTTSDMKKLIEYANQYIKRMNVMDIGLLKICVFSLGIIAGITLPNKYKEKILITISFIFVSIYVLVMGKFLSVMKKEFR